MAASAVHRRAAGRAASRNRGGPAKCLAAAPARRADLTARRWRRREVAAVPRAGRECSSRAPRRRSACRRVSICAADACGILRAAAQAAANARAAVAAAEKAGPMARPRARWLRRGRTVPSSCRRRMTSRRTPRNSQRQMIHALLVQRRRSRVRVAGSWMMPRLPMNRPRCSMATMSPKGVTRFCSGMWHSARSAARALRIRTSACEPRAIPAREFLVLGDSRGNSMDSRSWGTVPRDHVIGVYQP